MIISIDETRVIEAAQYANRLNQIKEHNCKACAAGYDNMLYSFQKMLKHPDDEVLICTEKNDILGVLALCVESKDKYLEAVGGVFAEENYQDIAMQFFEYLKDNYAGFHFDAAYPKENIEAICFMQSIGADCIGVELEMNLKKCDIKSSKGSKQVIPLNDRHYESFSRFHDENNPDVYWTGEHILSSLDKFDVFIALDKDEMVGSIVTSTFGNKRREIYFMETDKGYRRQGYAKSLLEKSIDRAFSSGANELMVIVGVENIPEINMYESFGFQIVDTCNTYSIESL
ncbi:MAG: GNAT family N-acetyltransferase [Candidatus Delongbacteria bacterium]|nr:GNAT family N-acetyltransferase [Candidatus Delongbacteria bacterium]MCG2759890.1 GNAT family N-acetyltransferase [Candidatus Delongbacteria bacterium]